ncbi:hypothetical protein L1049_024842 [Liquidambar formosana]|uniref:Protein kinase domain-containing protein n=1 Tax=Liquidambar formosana TaxID=63359 RepID=A0AAP0RWQ8_LIQFO
MQFAKSPIFSHTREMVSQSVLHIMLICLSKLALALAASLAKPGCQEKCGEVIIPYPFGIGARCYIHKDFEITCNHTFTPPKPFINSIGTLELLEVSLIEGTVRVNSPLISSNCSNRTNVEDVYLSGRPFYFSVTKNRFTAVACDNLALMKRGDTTIAGCLSICSDVGTNDSGCHGINCCQTTIPPSRWFINASFESIDPKNDRGGCKTAFMVDQEWFTSNAIDLHAVQEWNYVPVVIDWGIFFGTCGSFATMNASKESSLCGFNAHCRPLNESRKLCSCNEGYEGNPYLRQGCQDIDECSYQRHRCDMICINTPGSYKCNCSVGYVSNGNYSCFKLEEIYGKKSRVKVVVIGTGTSFGVLLLFLGMWWLYKIVKRRKKLRLKKRFFKRNGGLLFEQPEYNVDKSKLFTSKELEKATDHYNENRMLGEGGQGTVYKGMLVDGRIVAVKKSKMVDEGKVKQFINEVVILSQIIHINVVKLLGFCLETEVPLLVYEYIPNGTLSQYIHSPNEEFPVSWEMHLRIAVEVASALYYLHSAARIPIYHRDIKSSNILLDDKYRAKVSDFGTSRTIAVDRTHLTTTKHVHGTFGYLDPGYFQSGQFTEKSDVYSFGVVLVELLTGQKPISSTESEEGRNLVSDFLFSMKENRWSDIIDARILRDSDKEQIMAVANLAKRCLNFNGKKRPTMNEVAMELERIKNSNGGFIMQRNFEQAEYTVTESSGPWDAASTSTMPPLDDSTASSLDIQPLLVHTV